MKIVPPAPLSPVFVLSGAALAYEVILVRLLAMTRFHHLAFMVLSLVLLAYGVSGVLLAYHHTRLTGAFRVWFSAFAALFAGGAVLCFQLSQRIAVHPDQWLWSPADTLSLVLLYLVLSLPFLAAACGVGLAYCLRQSEADAVYRADLLGAAAGSLAGLGALWLPEAGGLWVPWCGGLAAAAMAVWPARKGPAGILLFLMLLGPAFGLQPAVRLIPSADKPLSIALSAEGARKLADSFSPLGRITVIRNTFAPYRHAPGLSLAFTRTVPPQWGAFADGEHFEPLPPAPEKSDTLAYLDYLPEALAYGLTARPRVLVLETPAMEHVARASRQRAARVDVVLSNPGWRALVNMAQVGRYFTAAGANLIIGAPRGFLRTGDQRYDLIVMGRPDGSALAADHLHTVEAFSEALARLAPNGLLTVSAPSDLPPRAGLRLLATVKEALKLGGVKDPGARLIFIRSLRTVCLIVKNVPLTSADILKVRAFCSALRFDPVWFPGITGIEANRWNRLHRPLFHDGAVALLGPDAKAFQRRYKFDISPVWDNRPYFSRFIKPATLGELFSLRSRGALGLLSFAEPVLAATLAQAVLLCLVLVWLPLRRFRPPNPKVRHGTVYFLLGAGFMLAEIAVIEKLGLYLSEPVLAVGVTLAAFLAVAGLGGGLARRLTAGSPSLLKGAGLAAAGVAGILLLYMTGLSWILKALIGLPLAARMVLALVLAAPLAFAMGLPFPLALSALKQETYGAVPWAWGLNGCGALIGPVAGIVLAVYGGITVAMGAAAFCYALVFLVINEK
ncbi:MAG: hypothetical protein PVH87_20780 [Desulfobacteraceae bacterium]|jgi:hypothetical protein